MSDAPDLQFEQPQEAAPHKWYSLHTLIPALAVIGTILVVVVAVIPSIIAARAPVIAAAEAKAAVEASATASKEAALLLTPIATEEAAVTPVPATTTSVPTEVAAVSTGAPTTAPRATNEPPTTVTTAAPTEPLATTISTREPTEALTFASTEAPTLAPTEGVGTAVPNVTLLYDQDGFTILNTSGDHLSLEGITFRGVDVIWEASSFGPPAKTLPNNRCLRIRDADVGNRVPPAECGGQIHGFREVEAEAIFWRGETFEVLRDNVVVATCQLAVGKCEIYVEPRRG